MTAYLVAEVHVQDPERYKQYTARTPDIIAKFGGRILVRGGKMETLEGHTDKTRVVIVEFPSMETARQFYNSPEYQEARAIRSPVSDAQFLIVEGA